jgi:hypothetical protein
MSICVISQRNHDYAEKIRSYFFFSVCEGKTFAHHPMRICVSVYFLKKSQPNISEKKSQTYTRCAWAGGTFFQLCCCVSFWFCWEIGFGFTSLGFGQNILVPTVIYPKYFA